LPNESRKKSWFGPSQNRWLQTAVLLFAALIVASQWRAAATENINWDEFALLSRAHDTVRTGRLVGGGRPGLAILVLLPIAQGCTNSVTAVVTARRIWLLFVVLYLAGVFALVFLVSPGRRYAWAGASIAVALLALVPVFLRWSLQVRTDQPALMFSVWGAVCLASSSRRAVLAVPAGLLFALGYLSSQKAVYVGLLALIIFLLTPPKGRSHQFAWRRVALIVLITGVSALAAVALYGVAVSFFYKLSPLQTFDAALNTFSYYRAVFGYRAYWAMLPSLGAHLVLLGMLMWADLSNGKGPAVPILCWLVLAVGVLIGAFHGGAFPYFWMTLGLFPAVAFGVGWESLAERYSGPAGRGFLIAAATLLLVFSIPAAINRHRDTQRTQRASLTFIDRNFDSSARGFHAEGALFCRPDPNPFRIYFADAVLLLLGKESGRERRDAFISEFRTRPVSFLITHRLFRFPEQIDDFWSTHYVVYRDEVMIPGRKMEGRKHDRREFDVIVPGAYNWFGDKAATAQILIDRHPVEETGSIMLTKGIHEFTLLEDVPRGAIALAVKDEPLPPGFPFYDPQAVRELDPLFHPELGPSPPFVRRP
jgi:hypothetical protein